MQTGELGADGRTVHHRSSISYARLPPTLLLLLLPLLPLLLLRLPPPRLLLLLLLLVRRRQRHSIAQLLRLLLHIIPWRCTCMHLNPVHVALLPLHLFLLRTLILLRLSSTPACNPSRHRPPLPLPTPGRPLFRTPSINLLPKPCLCPQPRPCLCHLPQISLLAHPRSLANPLL